MYPPVPECWSGPPLGEPQHAQQQMGHFDIHPKQRHMHLTEDEDILDQFAQAVSNMECLL